MSQTIRMLIDNLMDTATLAVTTGSEISTLPITNVQNRLKSKPAAITPDVNGTSVVTFNLPGLALVNWLVIHRHKLSKSSSWRLELFDGENQAGNLVFDSGTTDLVPTKTYSENNWFIDPYISSPFDGWPYKFSQQVFQATFVRSGRITMTDPNVESTEHILGRIYLGRAFQPKVNFTWGHEFQWSSLEEQVEMASGFQFANEREKFRKLSFLLDWVREDERPQMSNAIRKVGLSRDIFVSLFPEIGGQKEVDYSMACYFDGEIPSITGVAENIYSIPIKIREA